ncbi:protein-cysteine N-palmitoyltransferase Rasp [Anoplophora glabripennis]|uniref:protein-cysteine N-palmitoyltransferase Rasp n=1 Tax=Anoplophora glabripennis TaxID=217634 RepID=UPI000873D27B|nr:protein-cysteine N-palmitoyltransferase Rasp [Anoplophora glabripennis]
MNLKCTGYFLDKHSSKKLLNFLSYCLYPPTIFTGPFISINDYLNIYNSTAVPFWKRVQKLILNLGGCIFWYTLTNFCLHYIYVNATSYQPQLVKHFDSWSLYGYGYAMGQFFHIKYVVLYGLSTSFASFENVNVPHLPRCIGRIHLYSDMWKYFDPGLYKFLLR